MTKALVIEPKQRQRQRLVEVLREKGFAVTSADGPAEATAMLRKLMPDVVLLDVEMPERSGADLLRALQERSLPVILLTGQPSALSERITRLGAGVVRSQPLDVEALLKELDENVPKRRPAVTARTEKRDDSVPWGPHSFAAHVVGDLHDPETGRLDARRVAEYLAIPLSALADVVERSVAAVHKNSTSLPLQEKLGPVAWTIGALSLVLRSRENVLAWFNSPHPDLDGQTPLSLLLSGKAREVSEMIKAALAGQPS